MTDKELKAKILAEIESLREENEGKRKDCYNNPHATITEIKYYSGFFSAFDQIEEAINSIPEEPVSAELSEEIDYLSKRYPEMSFAKLSRIAVHVANWQKQQDQETIELAEDHAMLAGMVKGKEEMIEKACNYLHEHREEVKTEDNGIAGWISDEFIENFRKNMEE